MVIYNNVMKWQLFVSPEEVAGGGSFVAFIKDGSKTYHANNLSELEKIVQEIKEIKNRLWRIGYGE
ncbi:hypothetical protein [Prevotella denticola]|jgi:hypothetical protein|uniref:hypothetical protein n=2 Tax=Prevotella denticola TaxID=28129 RepID=UPI001BC83848|nr:hypothetical protein [Prevotella denticola]QUI93075.1 hypothetical protein J5A64_08800 [Prevotella denticola]